MKLFDLGKLNLHAMAMELNGDGTRTIIKGNGYSYFHIDDIPKVEPLFDMGVDAVVIALETIDAEPLLMSIQPDQALLLARELISAVGYGLHRELRHPGQNCKEGHKKDKDKGKPYAAAPGDTDKVH